MGEAHVWFSEPCMLGIDEAGRGPALGSMVYACAYCAIAQRDRLKTRGFADSKVLSEAKREELFESLKADDTIGWAVDAIDPRVLSAQMLRREKKSLNAIAYDSTYGLIQGVLDRGVYLKEVYIDTVGDADKYKARLEERFNGIQFTVCKKADSLFPIVSAASIVAKVTRDHALRDWEMEETGREIGRAFGSGYPADPDTKAWLLEHREPVFGFPSLVRFSWSTSRVHLEDMGVSVHWDGDEEDETAPPRKNKRVEYESSAVTRHSYFRTRQLQHITTKF